MKRIYHSALKEPLDLKTEIVQCSSQKGLAFRHDICKGLPNKYYDNCDVIYSEPAWLDGYSKFISRAGKEQSNYHDYLGALKTIIEQEKRPLWIVLGVHAHRFLPKAERILSISINGYKTTILGWNDDNDYIFANNFEFIAELAKKYNRIGDFCCGYGNSGFIFNEHGKSFVMSDINGKCISYIAQEAFGYEDSDT